MKRPSRLYILRRPKLRQSWNKYNLYNIAQMAGVFQRERMRTFFQQKFSAKSMTRAYHGENVGEKKWRRLFSRRLYTAVEMPPRYLAQYDGSEQGAGRGSGRELPPGEPVPSARLFSEADNQLPRLIASDRKALRDVDWRYLGLASPRDTVGETIANPTRKITPYMQMLYWPLERRLDTAIFRALFASSVRQARQFIVHGAVTVNGIKMQHPHYLLNPGDLFQVDIEKVMYATGEARTADYNSQERTRSEALDKSLATLEAEIHGRKIKEEEAEKEGEEAEEADEGAEDADADADAEAKSAAAEVVEAEPLTPEELKAQEKRVRSIMKKLIDSAKDMLSRKLELDLSVKDKQELRVFTARAKRLLPLHGINVVEEDPISGLTQLLDRFVIDSLPNTLRKAEEVEAEKRAAAMADKPAPLKPATAQVEALSEEAREKYEGLKDEGITRAEQKTLLELLRRNDENPLDERKPYKTPWAPRPYMAPFAYIPRYLEVNQKVCAAVYLRHPVAKRGYGEVPTPFGYEINQLAYTWYLKWRL